MSIPQDSSRRFLPHDDRLRAAHRAAHAAELRELGRDGMPARLAAQLDINGNAHEIAPATERLRLFEPAPSVPPGQLGGLA